MIVLSWAKANMMRLVDLRWELHPTLHALTMLLLLLLRAGHHSGRLTHSLTLVKTFWCKWPSASSASTETWSHLLVFSSVYPSSHTCDLFLCIMSLFLFSNDIFSPGMLIKEDLFMLSVLIHGIVWWVRQSRGLGEIVAISEWMLKFSTSHHVEPHLLLTLLKQFRFCEI